MPRAKGGKMHSATVAYYVSQVLMSWLQLLYSKSVRDLVQWSLKMRRDFVLSL